MTHDQKAEMRTNKMLRDEMELHVVGQQNKTPPFDWVYMWLKRDVLCRLKIMDVLAVVIENVTEGKPLLVVVLLLQRSR